MTCGKEGKQMAKAKQDKKPMKTCADWHSEKLHPCVVVTHWMSAKKLLKGAEDNAEIH